MKKVFSLLSNVFCDCTIQHQKAKSSLSQALSTPHFSATDGGLEQGPLDGTLEMCLRDADRWWLQLLKNL